MDERGLVELDDSIPKTSKIEGERAELDARDLTTRKINAELRWLIYEQGVRDVTVLNPSARHSLGVAILARCRIRFEGSLGYFGCGLIDGPEIEITGRVGWSVAENMMSGVVVVDEQRRLARRRRAARRRPRRQGRRRRAHRDRPEGRHDHRARQRRLDDRLHDAARPPDHLRRRRARARRLDVRRHDLRRRRDRGARHRLRRGRMERRRHRAGRAQVRQSTSSASRRSCASSSAARSSTTTTTSSPASASWSSREVEMADEAPDAREVLGTQPDLHAEGHQRHPHEGRARPLPDARLLDVQEDPALGRADLPAGHADAVRDRGLPGEVRDEDGARQPLRQEAARARHPRLHHRDELRRAVAGGEDGARQGRLDGRHGDLLGRGRDDPARARPLDQVVLPGDPEPLRLQPAPPDAGRRDRVLHRPGMQGRPRRPPDGPEGDRAGGRDALAAGRDRPALARRATPTGSAPTTSR